MSINAIVEKDMIRLPSGVHLPDGTRVRVVTESEQSAAPVAEDLFYRLAEQAEPLGRLTNEEIDTVIYGR